MTTVVFAMEWVPQYRVPFYDGLRKDLASHGIEVRLVHGDPPSSRRRRRDHSSLDWAEHVKNKFWTVTGLELTHQPVWKRLQGADLVILQQETGLVINYPTLAKARFGGPPVAFWGHGENPNPLNVSRPAELVKAKISRFADWFFAYTERSAEVFRSIGADPERITVVQNAMDTRALTDAVEPPSPKLAQLIDEVRERRARVGWIVSAFDAFKRVPFLIEVLDATRERTPNFEFFALGSGGDAQLLRDAAGSRPWLHMLGPTFGADKAAVGRLAEVTIQPGLIGLHVVESFATATPIITANLPYHSHEIDYLEPGVNGVMLPEEATATEMADAAVGMFGDAQELNRLQDGCRAATETYTLEAMIERFSAGVRAALAATSAEGAR